MANGFSTLANPERNIPRKKNLHPVPIPFERPKEIRLRKDQQIDFTLYNNPNAASSAEYKITVPIFRGGSPEEILKLKRALNQIFKGQGLVLPGERFATARRLLDGDPRSVFDVEASKDDGVETMEAYERSFDAVIRHVFPKDALRHQRRYMRRVLRKPLGVTFREYSTRVREMDAYLPDFPGADENSKMSDELLNEILEFSTPSSWQRIMALHAFEPSQHTIDEVVEFCERIELYEDSKKSSDEGGNGSSTKPSRAASSGTKGSPKSSARQSRKRVRFDDEESPEGMWCDYHQSDTHNTNKCKVVKAQIEKMRAQRRTHPDKRHRHGERDAARRQERERQQRKQEMFEETQSRALCS